MPDRKRTRCAWLLAALLIAGAILALMCLFSGIEPGRYDYPSYLLQAQAWLRGKLALDRNYEYLELAVYNGRYYVSFPPVPAIPMVLWALIWGDDVPGGLFQKIYASLACLIVMAALMGAQREREALPRYQYADRFRSPAAPGDCLAWAIFLCLGSALLSITPVGAVWYEAQILAFLFSVAAIAAMQRDRPTLCCFLYALAVGCRPFSVCLGPALLAMYLRRHHSQSASRKAAGLVPGLIVGFAIAGCYAAYNYARFGNIFEFGHNYLPEFQRAEHGQLSPIYIADNWRTLFFGSPFTIGPDGAEFEIFGFSMFLSCPILICELVWIISDVARHRFTREKLVIALMGALNTFLLLMHRTLGAHQFGLRYAIELIPLCLTYLLVSPERWRISRWEVGIMSFGLMFNFIGGILVHI